MSHLQRGCIAIAGFVALSKSKRNGAVESSVRQREPQVEVLPLLVKRNHALVARIREQEKARHTPQRSAFHKSLLRSESLHACTTGAVLTMLSTKRKAIARLSKQSTAPLLDVRQHQVLLHFPFLNLWLTRSVVVSYIRLCTAAAAAEIMECSRCSMLNSPKRKVCHHCNINLVHTRPRVRHITTPAVTFTNLPHTLDLESFRSFLASSTSITPGKVTQVFKGRGSSQVLVEYATNVDAAKMLKGAAKLPSFFGCRVGVKQVTRVSMERLTAAQPNRAEVESIPDRAARQIAQQRLLSCVDVTVEGVSRAKAEHIMSRIADRNVTPISSTTKGRRLSVMLDSPEGVERLLEDSVFLTEMRREGVTIVAPKGRAQVAINVAADKEAMAAFAGDVAAMRGAVRQHAGKGHAMSCRIGVTLRQGGNTFERRPGGLEDFFEEAVGFPPLHAFTKADHCHLTASEPNRATRERLMNAVVLTYPSLEITGRAFRMLTRHGYNVHMITEQMFRQFGYKGYSKEVAANVLKIEAAKERIRRESVAADAAVAKARRAVVTQLQFPVFYVYAVQRTEVETMQCIRDVLTPANLLPQITVIKKAKRRFAALLEFECVSAAQACYNFLCSGANLTDALEVSTFDLNAHYDRKYGDSWVCVQNASLGEALVASARASPLARIGIVNHITEAFKDDNVSVKEVIHKPYGAIAVVQYTRPPPPRPRAKPQPESEATSTTEHDALVITPAILNEVQAVLHAVRRHETRERKLPKKQQYQRTPYSVPVDVASEALALVCLPIAQAQNCIRKPSLAAALTVPEGMEYCAGQYPEYDAFCLRDSRHTSLHQTPEQWERHLSFPHPGLYHILRDAHFKLERRGLTKTQPLRSNDIASLLNYFVTKWVATLCVRSARHLHLPGPAVAEVVRFFELSIALLGSLSMVCYGVFFTAVRSVSPTKWLHIYARFRQEVFELSRGKVQEKGNDYNGDPYNCTFRYSKRLAVSRTHVDCTGDISRAFHLVLSAAGESFSEHKKGRQEAWRKLLPLIPSLVVRDFMEFGFIPQEVHKRKLFFAYAKLGNFRKCIKMCTQREVREREWLVQLDQRALTGLAQATRCEGDLEEVLEVLYMERPGYGRTYLESVSQDFLNRFYRSLCTAMKRCWPVRNHVLIPEYEQKVHDTEPQRQPHVTPYKNNPITVVPLKESAPRVKVQFSVNYTDV